MHKSNIEKCKRCLETHTRVIVNHIRDAKHIPLILHFLQQVGNICPGVGLTGRGEVWVELQLISQRVTRARDTQRLQWREVNHIIP